MFRAPQQYRFHKCTTVHTKLILLLFLAILLHLSVNGQTQDRSNIIGTWYLSNASIVESNDTLFFVRELIGNSFNLWDFKANNTLTISTGTIRGNNEQAKCFSNVLHYKWSLIETKNKVQIIDISFGEKLDKYSLLYLDLEQLKLLKLK